MTIKVKKMDEGAFDNILKEITAYAEMIRTKQDEKQAVINDLKNESRRLKSGKISNKSLAASISKIRKELKHIDAEIKRNIKNLQKAAEKSKKFAAKQYPKNLKLIMRGALSASKAKKHHHKGKK